MKTIFVVMVSGLVLMAGCLGGGEDSDGAAGRSSDEPVADDRPEMACVKVRNVFGCGDPETTTSCEAVYSKDQCQSSRTDPVFLDTCSFYSSTNAFLYETTCEQWSQEEEH